MVMPARHLRLAPAATTSEVAASDAELVERARGGDRAAAEELYRRHVAAALRLAMFLLRRRADAEDAVQDAFVSALTKLARLRDPAAFGGWLARIVTNSARGRLRRRRLLGWLGLDGGDDDATLDRLAAPGITAEQRAELAWLDRALRTLPDGERLAWTLRHVEGWELREIATALRISLATTKRRIAAAAARVGDRA
jgi:RNA polymerase sigma-70 factor (ECF subfamily)